MSFETLTPPGAEDFKMPTDKELAQSKQEKNESVDEQERMSESEFRQLFEKINSAANYGVDVKELGNDIQKLNQTIKEEITQTERPLQARLKNELARKYSQAVTEIVNDVNKLFDEARVNLENVKGENAMDKLLGNSESQLMHAVGYEKAIYGDQSEYDKPIRVNPEVLARDPMQVAKIIGEAQVMAKIAAEINQYALDNPDKDRDNNDKSIYQGNIKQLSENLRNKR